MCQEKNGYKNYQTNSVMDWLLEDNELLGSLENRSLGVTNNAVFAPKVRETVEQLFGFYDLPETGLVADLVGYALDSVEWEQVATAIRNRARSRLQ